MMIQIKILHRKKRIPKFAIVITLPFYIGRKQCCNISVIIAFKKRVAFLTDILFLLSKVCKRIPCAAFRRKAPFWLHAALSRSVLS